MYLLLLLTIECLRLNVVHMENKTIKIIGGRYVSDRANFSYQALVRRPSGLQCCGFILDHWHVGTAAHCLTYVKKGEERYGQPVTPSEVEVLVGNSYVYDSRIMRLGRTVILHPKFKLTKLEADVGILQLESPFDTWTKTIRPIGLSRTRPTNGVCRIAGWGYTNNRRKERSLYLLYADVPIVDLETCGEVYNKLSMVLPANVLCAGAKDIDSCQGDSGSALVCNKKIAGVVSFGYNCGVYPGIYTDISKYRKWIEKELEKSHCSTHSIIFPRLPFCLCCFIYSFYFCFSCSLL